MRLSHAWRYGPLARYYDALSGERVLYRAGRIAAIEALRLRPGDRVLDVGCGTGLNFPLLVEAVGPTGQVVGVDASGPMLARARRRIDAAHWQRQVQLVTADASHLDEELTGQVGGPFDAAIFAYSLSIVENWHAAWAQALPRARPGGRVAVVDTAYPASPWSLLAPVAWLMFTVGGVHPSRRVWELVAADTGDPLHRKLRGGHVHVAAGTARGGVNGNAEAEGSR